MDVDGRLTEMGRAISELNEDQVDQLLKVAISKKVAPVQLINELSAGMEEVGRLFKEGSYFLAELIYSGEIFKKAVKELKPLIPVESNRSSGTVVVGTVKNDVHDIGKNIVVTMLQSSGFEVIDVGVDAPAEKFLQAARSSGASLVGLSLLLTTGFESMHGTIKAFEAGGMRDRVKIMIGGGVISETVREQMGADYYGKDAIEAVKIAQSVYS